MIRVSLAFAALLLGSTATPLAAQDYPPAPPIGTPKSFAVPASETYTLDNGMRVTLVPFGIAPKAIVSLTTYAGSLNQNGKTGLPSLTADMLKEGAGARSAAELARAAAGMGGGLGVGAGSQSTGITLNILSERTPDAIALVGDVARRPTFPAEAFTRVKANALRNLALALSQPQPLAAVAQTRAYYGTDHPYGAILPSTAQLGGYTLDDVKRFHAANFGAKRAHLYISGRFDTAAVKAAVAKAFADWAPGPDRLFLPPSPKPGPQVILVDRPGAPQSTIRLSYPAPVAGSQGDISMRVMDALLSGSFGSRVTKNIREDKGYTYSPGSGISFRPGDTLWTLNADVTTAVTGASLKEIFSEIRKLQAEAPGAEEAAGMKAYLAGLFVFRNSTAGGLTGSLSERDMLGLPRDWLDGYVPAVLAVTPAGINGAVKSALPLDRPTLVVVGDLKTVEPQLKALPELKGMTFKTVTVP